MESSLHRAIKDTRAGELMTEGRFDFSSLAQYTDFKYVWKVTVLETKTDLCNEDPH